MSLPQAKIPFTAEDYLAWEANRPDKSKYVDGKVFAMSGASDAHATVALNLASSLLSALRGSPCRTFMSGMKVGVDAANSFFYPDILVTRDPRDRGAEASLVKRHPVLVIEVPSPSTEAYDRGRKFASYRLFPSLREYVLVSTEQRGIDVFRRDAGGHWVLYPFVADEELELASADFRRPVAEVFKGVEPEAPGSRLSPAPEPPRRPPAAPPSACRPTPRRNRAR